MGVLITNRFLLAHSEGALWAERGGIDLKHALDVMAGSAISSPMLKARAPFLKKLLEQSWFTLDLLHPVVRGGCLSPPAPA